MTSRALCLTLLSWLALAPSQAVAGETWTFCVASALGTKDVWISEVFAAPLDRERLEVELKRMLGRQGRSPVTAQCPLPSVDKVAVVNAQTTAEEFNSKIGSVLHEIPVRDFPPRQ